MNLRKMTKAVAYLRVSTDKQGKSGLGLEAQREAVARYVAANGVDLIGEHIEVETGKGANALSKRPELVTALATAKREKAGLIIAKLDRLARNVHFISGLMETGVEFAVADMPNADRFQLHLFAALAEKEAEVISQRTKAALAAAKDRGTELGKHGKVLAARNQAEAMDRLEPIAAELLALKAEGLSVRKMVEALNGRSIPSPAGGKWHPASLHKALARLEAR
ncbi:recombinase family protein [Sphingomonas sp.]|jgi:DNA invertase Pin-like site-specific DNA recombinase|uniref:recombinase family protein n=1 Tax=Sphingomonas sp. TaxID=28214 RepID=UPI0026116530|nr:recombinase family protein [Sphingomonas sp.]MDF2604972.1 resolvase [Sphingomonas sp.]